MERRSSKDHRSSHILIEDDTNTQGDRTHLLQTHDKNLDAEIEDEGLSIHVDTASFQRDRAMTIGSFRDRAFTLGSEFDLSTEPGLTDALLMTGHSAVNDHLDHITPSGTVISIASSNSMHKPYNPIVNDIPQTADDKIITSSTIHSLLDAYQRIHSSSEPCIQDRVENPLSFSQTPPSEVANNHELNHFGKRMRSGVRLFI